MDDKLIRKLQEEDLFEPPSDEEILQREKSRPGFRCPRCKRGVSELFAVPDVRMLIEVDAKGIVDITSLDQVDSYGNTSYLYQCPHCKEDITSYITEG